MWEEYGWLIQYVVLWEFVAKWKKKYNSVTNVHQNKFLKY